MIGQLKAVPASTSTSLRASLGAAALISLLSLTTSGAAEASTDMVNGQYCNDLCKAYMSWSNRVLATTQPLYARPQVRVAVPQSTTPKKMERAEKLDKPERAAPKPHRPANLNSFAQLPAGSHAAQSAMEPPPSDLAAADEPAGTAMERPFAADPLPHSAIADMRRATDAAGLRMVSMTDPGAGPTTVGEAGGSQRSRMPSLWILLAVGALIAYFGHGWLKRRNALAGPID
ncbi:hypothetical protein ACQR1Y_28075 [Bradyrhizobium sp. HKCCYLRH3099]|uniref:hypothetical protein n=1 Tax=unclassified Bradyrhizobium TaxID=2631580 RepID=UPI003EBE8F04